MNIEEINKLKQLDFIKQAAFAYLTCERLYPNYVYFSNNYGFGKPCMLREAIDYLYYNIFKDNPDKDKLNSLIKEINNNTPDTEDFTAGFVSSALDACTAIEDSLHFLDDKDFSRIINISTYATDTVNMYIQERENLDCNTDKNFQQKIDSHLLMQKEIFTQKGIISYLEKIDYLSSADIDTRCQLQENNKSNLDI